MSVYKKIPDNLNIYKKKDLIRFFFESYFNTDQDTEVYINEFQQVCKKINEGYIPIKLTYLNNEFVDNLLHYMPKLKPLYDNQYKTYLVFADDNIVRDIQIANGNLPTNPEDFENIDWYDIEKDILLGKYYGNCSNEVLENVANEYEIDIKYIYAIKIDNDVKIQYYKK